MTAIATLEVINDSEDSPVRTYWVEDDTDPGGAAVSLSEATTAVENVAPAAINGADPGAFRRQQISDFYWRISVPYLARQLRPLTPQDTGTFIDGCQFRAKAFRYFEGDPIDTLPNGAPSSEGLIGVERIGQENVHRGKLVTPPAIARTRRIVLTNAQVSSTYVSLVESMCVDPGTWNSLPIFGRNAGTVCLVAVNLSQRDDDSFSAFFGFGYRPESSVTVGDETVSLQGSDFIGGFTRKQVITVAGQKITTPKPVIVYQYRLQNFADLNTLFP